MKASYLALALLAASTSALAGKPGWDGWVQSAGRDAGRHHGTTTPTAVVVPAGSATYTGSTVALVSDSSSGTLVKSVSTGAISMGVTFSGTGTTTQTGSITGLTGTGASIGDLAFTGTGTGSKFSGTVTSTTYPTTTDASTGVTTGTGAISGQLSAPVVSGTTVSAPLSAKGVWNFVATSTLSAKGSFAAVR